MQGGIHSFPGPMKTKGVDRGGLQHSTTTVFSDGGVNALLIHIIQTKNLHRQSFFSSYDCFQVEIGVSCPDKCSNDRRRTAFKKTKKERFSASLILLHASFGNPCYLLLIIISHDNQQTFQFFKFVKHFPFHFNITVRCYMFL